MPITPPAAPTVGQRYSAAGITWEWNGTAWVANAPDFTTEYDVTRTYETGEAFVWPGATNPGGSHIYEVVAGPTTPGQTPLTDPLLFADIMAATGRMRGYMDPTVQNGGTAPAIPGRIINGDPDDVYALGDYVIAVADSDQLYDESTGTPTTGPTAIGTRIFRGDRFVLNTLQRWNKLTPPEPTGWGLFDATQPGGGNGIPQPVINGSRWWFPYDHCIVGTGGRYNLNTGQPDPAEELLTQGQFLVYDGAVFQVTRSVEQRMIGFFDPTVAGGGVDVPDPIIDGTPNYVAGEYAIASAAGSYDFTTGLPSSIAPALQVLPSDTVYYDGLVWVVLSSQLSTVVGYMNPTQVGGQPPAPFPVINGSTNYQPFEVVVSQSAGTYNFITGQPGSGVSLVMGDRLTYSTSLTWVKDNFVSGLLKGQFMPTQNNGGPLVDFPVVNGNPSYAARATVISVGAGWYHFGTGLAGEAPGAVWVRNGENIIYSGTVWQLTPVGGTSNWGWFDASVAGGGAATEFPPVTNTQAAYEEDDWFTVLADGNYNFITGQPDPLGTALKAGDVIRRDIPNARWQVYSSGAATGAQTFAVTQNAHGFAVGMPIALAANGTWARAAATGAANLKAATVVLVTSANTFLAAVSGVLRLPAHGLILGGTYYLSTTAGGYSTASPARSGQFIQPHLAPISLDEVFIYDGSIAVAV